eukprot:CAMPEP_0206845714 /NCGR_PEP_ID=MMETSP0975-20121206/24627_1 /ASSEMBLY_ACC=CAM_ASM_000399 /TAXON_ID=483370 /ORGANISM="non described non described, Strain CCMP2097" /LENGTH=356 /DNA_ID=CAMNT_0054388299 /DNA_START=46 /DNA_END=1113 /DNA_ORIENTATION=+
MALVTGPRRRSGALLRCAVLCCASLVARGDDVRLIRTTWGAAGFDDASNWAAWFSDLAQLKVRSAGAGATRYSGIEAPTWVVCGVSTYSDFGCGGHACNETRSKLFRSALESSGLEYVAQVHTCGYPIASAAVEEHTSSLKALVAIAQDLGASLANVHGGVDSWGNEERSKFFDAADDVENDSGLPLAHETHRMRALSTPWATRDALAAFPKLKLTADLSHWVIVAERAFDFPADAAWWPPLLESVSSAAVLTHTRRLAARDPGRGPRGARMPGAARALRVLVERHLGPAEATRAARLHRGRVRADAVHARAAAHEAARRRLGRRCRVHRPPASRPRPRRRMRAGAVTGGAVPSRT